MLFFFSAEKENMEVADSLDFKDEQAYSQNFEKVWEDFNNNYPKFFKKATDWQSVKKEYSEKVEKVKDDLNYTKIISEMLDDLYDPGLESMYIYGYMKRHSCYDIYARMIDNKAIVLDVKKGSAAERAGIRKGDVIEKISGQEISTLLPAASDKEKREWFLNKALSGKILENRKFTVVSGKKRYETVIEADDSFLEDKTGVQAKIFKNQCGYLRIDNFLLRKNELLEKSLAYLKDCKGIMIDLRGSSGEWVAAKRFLGHFMKKKTILYYLAMRESKNSADLGKLAPVFTDPEQPYYSFPVVILVDRWTRQGAARFAFTMDSIGRAKVIGDAISHDFESVSNPSKAITAYRIVSPKLTIFHNAGFHFSYFEPEKVLENKDLVESANQKLIQLIMLKEDQEAIDKLFGPGLIIDENN